MEALNSSCSKAIIVDLLGTHVPKCAPLVSNTPKFSLSPNDKKGCNFVFPKLVQNKGVFPLHAVPSKTLVDLDSLVLQAQEQPKEPKTIHVTFQLQRNCKFGEQFLVVGNDPLFGSWNPANAIPMTWSEGHVWTVKMGVPAGKFQFKFVLKRREGDIVWQPGPDRIIHTWEAMNRITVYEDWEDVLLQKVTEDGEVPNSKEEDQLAQANMELQIESEMPNFAENLGRPKEKPKSNAPKVMKNTR
ncbi:Glucoamylase protein [Spatholobus suberectus]|nr:Glucoamylase protein [Spatholobus suberectus]